MGVRLRYIIVAAILLFVIFYFYTSSKLPPEQTQGIIQPIVSHDGRFTYESPFIFIGKFFRWNTKKWYNINACNA